MLINALPFLPVCLIGLAWLVGRALLDAEG